MVTVMIRIKARARARARVRTRATMTSEKASVVYGDEVDGLHRVPRLRIHRVLQLHHTLWVRVQWVLLVLLVQEQEPEQEDAPASSRT